LLKSYGKNRTYDINEIVNDWKNILNHFQDNHQHCKWHKCMLDEEKCHVINKEESILLQYLEDVIVQTLKIVENIDPLYSTQYNECGNSIKTKYAQKNIKWNNSFAARMTITALEFMNPIS